MSTYFLVSQLQLMCPQFQAEILATCQENINGMGAMLRGPTVTVLSPKRCHEMRGKRIKMFVVIANANAGEQQSLIDQQMGRRSNSTTTSSSSTNANPGELCKCAQFKRKLTTLYRRAATVHRAVIGGSWLGSRNSYLIHNDRTVSRFIFYAKVTILTELFGLLRGILVSIN